MNIFKTFLAISLVFITLFAFSPPAHAGDAIVDAGKVAGTVGERIDGYLGIVDSSIDAATRRRVMEVNNLRRAAYDQLAAQTNTTTAQVARVSGEKLIRENVGPGQYYMDESGQWKRR